MRDAAWGSAPARPPPPPPLPVCQREGSYRHRHRRRHRRLGPAPAMAQIFPIRFQEHFQVRPGLWRRGRAGYRAGRALHPVSRAPGRPASRGTGRGPLTDPPPRPAAPGPRPWTPTPVDAAHRPGPARVGGSVSRRAGRCSGRARWLARAAPPGVLVAETRYPVATVVLLGRLRPRWHAENAG